MCAARFQMSVDLDFFPREKYFLSDPLKMIDVYLEHSDALQQVKFFQKERARNLFTFCFCSMTHQSSTRRRRKKRKIYSAWCVVLEPSDITSTRSPARVAKVRAEFSRLFSVFATVDFCFRSAFFRRNALRHQVNQPFVHFVLCEPRRSFDRMNCAADSLGPAR